MELVPTVSLLRQGTHYGSYIVGFEANSIKLPASNSKSARLGVREQLVSLLDLLDDCHD